MAGPTQVFNKVCISKQKCNQTSSGQKPKLFKEARSGLKAQNPFLGSKFDLEQDAWVDNLVKEPELTQRPKLLSSAQAILMLQSLVKGHDEVHTSK